MKFRSWKNLTLLQSLTPTLLWQKSSFWYLFQIGYYLLQQPSGFSWKQTSWPKPELESALDNHKTMTDFLSIYSIHRYTNAQSNVPWKWLKWCDAHKNDKKCDFFMQKAGLNGSLEDTSHWYFTRLNLKKMGPL